MSIGDYVLVFVATFAGGLAGMFSWDYLSERISWLPSRFGHMTARNLLSEGQDKQLRDVSLLLQRLLDSVNITDASRAKAQEWLQRFGEESPSLRQLDEAALILRDIATENRNGGLQVLAPDQSAQIERWSSNYRPGGR